jgi:PAS domain S-box-containing protein
MTELGGTLDAGPTDAAARRRPWARPWVLALVLGTVASVVGYLAAAAADDERRGAGLRLHLSDRAQVLAQQVREVGATLAQSQAAVEVLGGRDLPRIRRWMESLEVGAGPWVTYGWVPRVAPGEREGLEAASRAAGIDRLHLQGEGVLAPFVVGSPAGRSATWVGWNLLGDRTVRAALAEATGRGGGLVVSAGVALPGATAPERGAPSGALLVRAVPPSDGRGGEPLGWVVGFVDVPLLLGGVVDAFVPVGMDLYLFDGPAAAVPFAVRGTRFLPESRVPPWTSVPADAPRAEQEVRAGNRTWVLRAVPTSRFVSGTAPWHAWFTLVGGILVSVIVAAALRTASRREADVRRAVDDRTTELSRMNEVLRAEIGVRRAAEASLARATDRLDVVLSSLTDGVVATDAEGRVSFMNPVAEALAGRSRDESRCRPLGEVLRIVTDDRAEPVALPTVGALAAERVLRPEVTGVALARDGSARPVAWRALAMRDHLGGAFGSLVVLRDLSDVRRREEAVREQEALFDALSAQLPESLLLADAEDPEGRMRILYANESAARAHGYEPGELVGRSVLEITSPEEAVLSGERLARLRAGAVLVFETTQRRRDGTHFPAEVTVRSIRWRGRRAILGIVRDVSERRRGEEERRRLEVQAEHARRLESLRSLAGEVAHDFNNALTGILGNAELALFDLGEGSPVRGRVEEILRAGRRATELTQQMLAWSGRSHVALRPVRLDDLVREAAARAETAFGPRVRVALDLPRDLPSVQGDPHRLQRLLEDLLAHAAGATGDRQGRVDVRLSVEEVSARWLAGAYGAPGLPEGRYVVLEVADEGRTADDEALRRIFEPSFRAPGVAAGPDLSALPGILRAHQGAIRVRSDAKGTTYRVVLPPAA